MVRKSHDASRKLWQQRIDRQRQSGLTVAQFCKRAGVSQAGYYYWKRKLRIQRDARGPERTAGNGTPRGRGERHPAPTRPALGETPFVQLPMPAAKASPWIELLLNEGTVIRIPQQNSAALAMVLAALHGERQEFLPGEIRHA